MDGDAPQAPARRKPRPERQAAFRVGLSAESRAAAFLVAKGFRILARRWRSPLGEIDIVASIEGVTVFVEVKTRVGEQFGGGEEAITAWKQRRMTQMAVDYLARHRLHDRPCRFDVVAIDMDSGRPRIQVYAHAFDATS